MKNLIDNIYKVIDEGVDDTEDAVEDFCNSARELLTRRLSPQKPWRNNLIFSSIGQCVRKQYYQFHGVQGEKLEPHTKLKFIYGDIIELLLIALVKLAGYETRGEQDLLSLDGVRGRRDVVINNHNVDIKSASTYSFKKFQTGAIQEDDPFGYMMQLACYLEAADDVNKDTTYNLVMDKQHGHITLFEPLMLPNAAERIKEVKNIVAQDTPPERPYEPVPEGKAGNMKLPVTCSYCQFKKTCWEGLRGFAYSNGPVYLTNVEKLPKVPEFAL